MIKEIISNIDDDFLKPKVVLLIIYASLFTLSVVITDGSVVEILQRLLLQVGEAISSPAPTKVPS